MKTIKNILKLISLIIIFVFAIIFYPIAMILEQFGKNPSKVIKKLEYFLFMITGNLEFHKISTKTKYFAKKISLWYAIEYFCENRNVEKIKIFCYPEGNDFTKFDVTFKVDKLITALGVDFRNSFEQIKLESHPQGRLYHKKDILKVYNESQ